MLFDSFSGLLRVVVVGTLAYAAVAIMLRTSGKRTLSKLNAFDFVVTIALGSTLATIILSKDVALAEGVAALALLAGLQYVVAWLCVRSKRIEAWVKSEPTLLMRKGEYLQEAMRRERVTSGEILAAVRGAGGGDLSEIDAVILETDGTLSVVRTSVHSGIDAASAR
ncbi:MAG: DUF421 domain-containing protein [Beijerinckiaceae bacterium]|nr:DUF421 domain-containing protein [Beijerinckiaceae bacterium]